MVVTVAGRQIGRVGVCREHILRDSEEGFKKNELKPWKVKGWVIPPFQNGDFVASMEQVLDVYKRPYDKQYPVICMDESPKQLIREVLPNLAPRPGQVRRQDYEYERCGVSNVFLASEPLKGKRYIEITSRKTKSDWANFIKRVIDEWYKDATRVTLVMDNLSTHKLGALYETFRPEEAKRISEKIELVYTPKHGSWLNMAEIELNILMNRCLNRRIDNIETIRREAVAWQNYRNEKSATINWQFTNDQARVKLKRLYPTIIE